jgi:hypothetical protein
LLHWLAIFQIQLDFDVGAPVVAAEEEIWIRMPAAVEVAVDIVRFL